MLLYTAWCRTGACQWPGWLYATHDVQICTWAWLTSYSRCVYTRLAWMCVSNSEFPEKWLYARVRILYCMHWYIVHPKCSLLKLAYSKTTQGQPQQKQFPDESKLLECALVCGQSVNDTNYKQQVKANAHWANPQKNVKESGEVIASLKTDQWIE